MKLRPLVLRRECSWVSRSGSQTSIKSKNWNKTKFHWLIKKLPEIQVKTDMVNSMPCPSHHENMPRTVRLAHILFLYQKVKWTLISGSSIIQKWHKRIHTNKELKSADIIGLSFLNVPLHHIRPKLLRPLDLPVKMKYQPMRRRCIKLPKTILPESSSTNACYGCEIYSSTDVGQKENSIAIGIKW